METPKTTYDRTVDAAYAHQGSIAAGEVKTTTIIDTEDVSGDMVNLDFDGDHRLVGIEALNASRRLPASLLDSAEIIA